MILKGLKPYFFAIALFSLVSHGIASPWRFEVGAGARNVSPLVLVAGLGYDNYTFRVQGLGAHSGPRDFWCGVRGSLLWTFFKELPFYFDAGLGVGYEFAEAPNKMHQALNDANKGNFLYPYNYRENMDISLELWTHLYGVYTQISVPAYRFMDHDVPDILWGIGYMFNF